MATAPTLDIDAQRAAKADATRSAVETLMKWSHNGMTPFSCDPTITILSSIHGLSLVLNEAHRDADTLGEKSDLREVRSIWMAEAMTAIGQLSALALWFAEQGK